jgi:hypothetical protein
LQFLLGRPGVSALEIGKAGAIYFGPCREERRGDFGGDAFRSKLFYRHGWKQQSVVVSI